MSKAFTGTTSEQKFLRQAVYDWFSNCSIFHDYVLNILEMLSRTQAFVGLEPGRIRF